MELSFFSFMGEKRDDQRKQIKRYSLVGERDCVLGVISFNNLEWSELRAKVIDLSITGVGIESDQVVKPGIVLFNQCLCGQRFGILVWCKEHFTKYRAGIEFISLSRAEEDYIRLQIQQLPHKPIQDRKGIISMLSRQNQLNIDKRVSVER